MLPFPVHWQFPLSVNALKVLFSHLVIKKKKKKKGGYASGFLFHSYFCFCFSEYISVDEVDSSASFIVRRSHNCCKHFCILGQKGIQTVLDAALTVVEL